MRLVLPICEVISIRIAYVKLSWALANYKDSEKVKEIMRTPLVNEMSERREF